MRLDRIIGRSKTPKFIVLLIAVLLLVGWNAEPALAQNLYAIATVEAPSANENFLGGYAQWKTPTQYTTVDGGFTSQVIWVTTQNQQNRWVEVGLTKGWKGDDSIWTMQVLKAGTWKYWNEVGSLSEYDDSPFVWEWRDTGTYKLGKTYKN